MLLLAVPVIVNGQGFKKNPDSESGLGHGEVFNPFKNVPKDSTKKNTMSIDRLYGYLKDNIDPIFLPQDIQKELSK